MDLNVAGSNVNYSMLRLQSENGIWEMGIYPTMYGTRVSCGRIGSDFYIKGGYCCGRSPVLLMEVTICIAGILSSFPETAMLREVEAVFPQWELRPIDLDDGLDKLREVFVARCGSMEVGQPLKNAETILEHLRNVCDRLDFHRSQALRKELSFLEVSP